MIAKSALVGLFFTSLILGLNGQLFEIDDTYQNDFGEDGGLEIDGPVDPYQPGDKLDDWIANFTQQNQPQQNEDSKEDTEITDPLLFPEPEDDDEIEQPVPKKPGHSFPTSQPGHEGSNGGFQFPTTQSGHGGSNGGFIQSTEEPHSGGHEYPNDGGFQPDVPEHKTEAPVGGHATSKPHYEPEPTIPTTQKPQHKPTKDPCAGLAGILNPLGCGLKHTTKKPKPTHSVDETPEHKPTKDPCSGLAGILNPLGCGLKHTTKKPSSHHDTQKPGFGDILGGIKDAVDQNKDYVDKAVDSVKDAGEKVIGAGKDIVEAGWKVGESLVGQHKGKGSKGVSSLFLPGLLKFPDGVEPEDDVDEKEFKQDANADVYDEIDEE